jgi:hypothetical protein
MKSCKLVCIRWLIVSKLRTDSLGNYHRMSGERRLLVTGHSNSTPRYSPESKSGRKGRLRTKEIVRPCGLWRIIKIQEQQCMQLMLIG